MGIALGFRALASTAQAAGSELLKGATAAAQRFTPMSTVMSQKLKAFQPEQLKQRLTKYKQNAPKLPPRPSAQGPQAHDAPPTHFARPPHEAAPTHDLASSHPAPPTHAAAPTHDAPLAGASPDAHKPANPIAMAQDRINTIVEQIVASVHSQLSHLTQSSTHEWAGDATFTKELAKLHDSTVKAILDLFGTTANDNLHNPQNRPSSDWTIPAVGHDTTEADQVTEHNLGHDHVTPPSTAAVSDTAPASITPSASATSPTSATSATSAHAPTSAVPPDSVTPPASVTPAASTAALTSVVPAASATPPTPVHATRPAAEPPASPARKPEPPALPARKSQTPAAPGGGA